MPTITQLQVMNQTKGKSNGHETCGYHTFKNAMLSLLHQQGEISTRDFETLRKDSALFEAMFQKAKQVVVGQGVDLDLTLPRFIELLKKAKSGEYDFTAQGLSKALLQKINLDKISVLNYVTAPHAPLPGLYGLEEELSSAAAMAKLATAKGPDHHAFAVGINNQHWITATVKKDVHGQYTWDFMDSWHNSTTYKTSVPSKIEQVLAKNPAEMRQYLLDVYTNSANTVLLNRRYTYFFDETTGLTKPDVLIEMDVDGDIHFLNAKEYFVDDVTNKEDYVNFIENRFSFMQSVGWLPPQGDAERKHVKQLHSLANFMLQNLALTDVATKDKLTPMCAQLKAALDPKPLPEHEPDLGEKAPEHHPEVEEKALEKQTIATIHAVENQEPHRTEGFVNWLVNSIKNLLEGIATGISNAFNAVASWVGIKA